MRQRSDTGRGSAAQRGYDVDHELLFRQPVLNRDRTCVLCGLAPSTVADHWPLSRRELQRHGLDPNDPKHGRGLCARCDRKQTAKRQPGGWARRPTG